MLIFAKILFRLSFLFPIRNIFKYLRKLYYCSIAFSIDISPFLILLRRVRGLSKLLNSYSSPVPTKT